MLLLAILLAVHDRFHSFAVAGVAVGAFTLGLAAAAPILGAAVDRLGPQAVLPPVAVVHAVALVALASSLTAGAPRLLVVVLALLAGSAVPPISASVRAVWMVVITDDDVRDQAFTIDAMATAGVFAVGPLVTTVIVLVSAASVAILVAALVALVGTVIYVRSPILSRTPGAPMAAAVGRETRHGRLGVLLSTGLAPVLACVLLVGAAGGVMAVTLPALAVHLGYRAASGIIVGLWAAAGIAGGWIYARVHREASMRVRYRAVAVVAALLTLPMLGASSIAVAIVLSTLAGLPTAALYACQYSIVGELAPSDSTTESFTWMVAAIVAGEGIGSVLAGAVITASGVAGSFALAAALLAGTTLVRIRGGRSTGAVGQSGRT
jgi:MFS family permease